MTYLEYEVAKARLKRVQSIYESLLSEKESILASNYDIEKVCIIDDTIERLRKTISDREEILSMREHELMNSKDLEDNVYRLRYMEKYKVKRIARIVHYSDTQVYRILQQIQETLNTVITP